MSLAQQAATKHQDILAHEAEAEERDKQQFRERYVELMLSGDDTPEAASELSIILTALEEELTPEQMLADAAMIEKAREQMKLHADLPAAQKERRETAYRPTTVELFGQELLRHERRLNHENGDYARKCSLAQTELRQLAQRYPQFFNAPDGQTPSLVGTSFDDLKAKGRLDRLRNTIEWQMQLCDAAIEESEHALSGGMADENHPLHHYAEYRKFWIESRLRERDRLEHLLDRVNNGEEVTLHTSAELLSTLGSFDKDPSETVETGEFVNNQDQAALALGLTDEEWSHLKDQPGFPARTSRGWNITAISEWLSTAESDA